MAPVAGEPPGSQYYFRGGGFYMSNGSVAVEQATIVENAVTGIPAMFNNKPNMGGGGMTATIGNAHVVENMKITRSIIAGNTVGGAIDDVYTGSLLEFTSGGHNLVGHLTVSQILVPIPPWWSLSRKHWPNPGDATDIRVKDVLSTSKPQYHSWIKSVGTDAGKHTIVWMLPLGAAVDQIPRSGVQTRRELAQFEGPASLQGSFLNDVLAAIRTRYGSILGNNFGEEFGDLSALTFAESPITWPSDPANAPWIGFWRSLDTMISGRLGDAYLADDFWGTFQAISYGYSINHITDLETVGLTRSDQRGRLRPHGRNGDIGAIER